ncbi:MAG: PAS domain S-box protein [Methylococcaceae bacterium]|nr:PAS domain S-box protein [Methylococcaceae bacterium]
MQLNPETVTPEAGSANSALSSRIPLLLFLLFVLGLSALASAGYRWFKNHEVELAQDTLSSIADLKQKQIAEWMANLRKTPDLMISGGLLAYTVERWLRDGKPANEDADRIRKRLAVIREVNELASVHLIDREGRGVMTSGLDIPPPAIADTLQALQDRSVRVTGVHRADGEKPGETHVDVIAPLTVEKDGHLMSVGALAYHIELANYLFPLIQSWPTPSATAETLLVQREDDQVVFLNRLRHRPDAPPLRLRQPITGETPAARGIGGELGIMEGFDYRGVAVLADVRRIPGTPWIMVAKQDLHEIYRPVRHAGWLGASLALSLNGLFGLVIWHWYKRRLTTLAFSGARTEARMASLELRFASVLREANDIILLMSDSGVILDANRRAFETYGYPPAELIGMDARRLCETAGCDSVDAWTTPDGKPFETLHRRADGAAMEVEVGTRLIASGGQRYLQAIIRDIGERKRAEAEIRALNANLELRVQERTAALEQAIKEQESFSYSIAHDLRIPLRAIDGFSQKLALNCEPLLDDEGRRLIQVVRRNAVRMAQLIDDILRFSRMSRCAMNFIEIDMNSLVREVFDEVRNEFPSRSISLDLGALPAAHGDLALIRQVVVNLLSNAAKFTAIRTHATIRVEGGRDDGHAIYCVTDNGVGFDMQYVDKLFGVFHRLHGIDEFEGTGIGLAIVKRVVMRHGGWVSAEAKTDEGASFRFSLPVAPAPGLPPPGQVTPAKTG